MTLRPVLVVTLRPRGFGGGCPRTHRSPCPSRDLAVAGGCSTRGGLDVLCRARHLAQVVLRAAPARADRGTSGGARAPDKTTQDEPVEADRRGQAKGPGGCELRWSPPGSTTGRSACTTRCTRWGWSRCPRSPRLPGSSARPALPAWSRRRSQARHGGGSSTPHRTHADARRGLEQVLVITDGDQPGDKITVADLDGEILIEHTRPGPGVNYVGNGHPRVPRQDPRTSPMS